MDVSFTGSVLNVQWHGTNRHANVRRPVDAEKGDMLNQTRKLLEDFYRPFNEEMCRLTGDTSFLYKHTT